MKHFKYFMIFNLISINISLIGSDREFPLPTLKMRELLQSSVENPKELLRRDFNEYCTKFNKLKRQQSISRLFAHGCLTLTCWFSWEACAQENSSNAAPYLSILFGYLTAKSHNRKRETQELIKEFIKTCSQEFSSEELEKLQNDFYQLNPSTPMNENSLLFLAKRQQWLLKNKSK